MRAFCDVHEMDVQKAHYIACLNDSIQEPLDGF
jgi:hypothetical protein